MTICKSIIKKTSCLLSVALLLFIFLLLSCDDTEEKFGIFLIETGELVLSGEHIEAYHVEAHEIELNKQGIEKWNSYMTYETIPRLYQTLNSKDFVVKVGNDEVYRGKFLSMVSSTIPDGIIIVDSLFKLDDTHNTIQIELGYIEPQSEDNKDPRNNTKVLNFFKGRGLLK